MEYKKQPQKKKKKTLALIWRGKTFRKWFSTCVFPTRNGGWIRNSNVIYFNEPLRERRRRSSVKVQLCIGLAGSLLSNQMCGSCKFKFSSAYIWRKLTSKSKPLNSVYVSTNLRSLDSDPSPPTTTPQGFTPQLSNSLIFTSLGGSIALLAGWLVRVAKKGYNLVNIISKILAVLIKFRNVQI